MTDVKRRLLSTVLSGLMLAASASGLVACTPRAITPAEIDRNGTKTFYGRNAGQVVHATVSALRTLGYEVVIADVASGKVKTAPKLVVVHAVGNQYHATAIQDTLAWSVDFVRASDGTVVRLHPRMFRNGQPLDNSLISADAIDRSFVDLFREIDENLPGGGAPLGTPSGAATNASTSTSTATASTAATSTVGNTASGAAQKSASSGKPSKSAKYAKTAQ